MGCPLQSQVTPRLGPRGRTAQSKSLPELILRWNWQSKLPSHPHPSCSKDFDLLPGQRFCFPRGRSRSGVLPCKLIPARINGIYSHACGRSASPDVSGSPGGRHASHRSSKPAPGLRFDLGTRLLIDARGLRLICRLTPPLHIRETPTETFCYRRASCLGAGAGFCPSLCRPEHVASVFSAQSPAFLLKPYSTCG